MATVTDIKDIKYDLVKGIFEIDDMDIIRKIKNYVVRVRKGEPNRTTMNAIKDAKKGKVIHCGSFEEYLKLVQ